MAGAGTVELSILSWNVNGLEDVDDGFITARVLALLDIAFDLCPSIILLQEVTPSLQGHLIVPLASRGYTATSREPHHPYYTIIYCRTRAATSTATGKATAATAATGKGKGTASPLVKVRSQSRTHFSCSRMGRDLLRAEVEVEGAGTVEVLTSHLESTKSGAHERLLQAKKVLGRVRESGSTHLTVFCGDTNLRNKEAEDAFKALPAGHDVHDAWEEAGRHKEYRSTWHMGQIHARFDRAFYKHPPAVPGAPWAAAVRLTGFRLVGTKDLPAPLNCRPSDHDGVVLTFSLPAVSPDAHSASRVSSASSASTAAAASSKRKQQHPAPPPPAGGQDHKRARASEGAPAAAAAADKQAALRAKRLAFLSKPEAASAAD